MTEIVRPITNRWIVIPLVLVLAFAAALLVHNTTQDPAIEAANPACRPVCTQWLGGVCVGRWIPWRIPYPCYPY